MHISDTQYTPLEDLAFYYSGLEITLKQGVELTPRNPMNNDPNHWISEKVFIVPGRQGLKTATSLSIMTVREIEKCTLLNALTNYYNSCQWYFIFV